MPRFVIHFQLVFRRGRNAGNWALGDLPHRLKSLSFDSHRDNPNQLVLANKGSGWVYISRTLVFLLQVDDFVLQVVLLVIPRRSRTTGNFFHAIGWKKPKDGFHQEVLA